MRTGLGTSTPASEKLNQQSRKSLATPPSLSRAEKAKEAAKAKEREAWLARKNYNPLKVRMLG